MRSFAWAGDWPVSQVFDDPCCRRFYWGFGLIGHNGIDIACPTGTLLLAAEAGTVTEAYNDPGGYGWTVYLLGASGRGWRYGHASTLLVGVRQWVDAGQAIAYSGYSGNVRPAGPGGAHLHLGVRPAAPNHANGWNGYVDPLPLLLPAPPPPAPPVVVIPGTNGGSTLVLTNADEDEVGTAAWEMAGAAWNPGAAICRSWLERMRAASWKIGMAGGGPGWPLGAEGALPDGGVYQRFTHGLAVWKGGDDVSWSG